MKYLKHFANAQEAATILATWPFNTISSIQGQEGASFSEGVPVGPVGPTDRVILTFMVTAEDWNEDAGKYKKILIGESSGSVAYDGSCFEYMIKDNERIDEDFWSMFIYFDTLGEHTVELIFNEEFDGIMPSKCFLNSEIYEVVIPSCVTSMHEQVFSDCHVLTSVTIPNGVDSIGSQAFCGCGSLISIVIPESVTEIGADAFQSCDLTSIVIPEYVTYIGDSAFHGCEALTFITCNAINPPYCNYGMFDYTNNCPIYVPASSVDAYKVADGWSEYASRIQAIQS